MMLWCPTTTATAHDVVVSYNYSCTERETSTNAVSADTGAGAGVVDGATGMEMPARNRQHTSACPNIA
jgi:hypothetical protein